LNWAQAASLRQREKRHKNIAAKKQEMFSRDNKQSHKI